MKKFLGILVIAASLVACNNSSDGTTANDTLNTNVTDSNTTVNQTINTTTDSTKVVVDSTVKKDSVNK